ncbi:MAG TPA: glycoside hydrolase family 11 protein [Polyangiaceae bacterium]|nr:glycoside hydrolase family 11 protein [Polyangiaceae bacterium]
MVATVLLIAGCAVGTVEDDLHDQAQAGARPKGSGGAAGHGVGGAPITGSGGTTPGPFGGGGKGGTTSGVAGSPSGGLPSFGGSKGGGGGSGPIGAGGKSFGFGGTASGGKGGGIGVGGSPVVGGKGGSGPVTGGSGSTSVPSGNCTEANKTVTGNGTGKHCSYTYEYWKDSGNGTLTLKPDGFSLDWSGVGDLLGRKGIRPGSANLVVTYQADYQPSGNSYLCIYGWTRSPLVEYYIVDSWGNWRPPGGQGHVGTVTTDGGTYDIYKIAKSGPNIDGNGSFTQYWSVRTAKQTSGVITVGNHFNAWKSSGLAIGNFYEVSMTVEGYQSSGKADVKFSMQ